MFALLFLLGLGASVFVVDSLSGDDDSSADDATSTDSETELSGVAAAQSTMLEGTDEADIFVDEGLRTGIERIASDNPDDVGFDLADAQFTQDPVNYETKAGDDIVLAGGADNIVNTADGDDIVVAGAGNDIVDLGGGDDFYGSPEDTDEAERLGLDLTNSGDDQVFGRKGDDEIVDLYGRNTLAGNEGEDVIVSLDFDTTAAPTSDIISGGWGKDLLMFDQGDTATGGNGEDEFSLDIERLATRGADFQPAIITDFEPGVDFINLVGSETVIAADNGNIALNETDAGTTITVSGIPVAVLNGATNLATDDVFANNKPVPALGGPAAPGTGSTGVFIGSSDQDVAIDSSLEAPLKELAAENASVDSLLIGASFVQDPSDYDTGRGSDFVIAGTSDNVIDTGSGDDIAFGGLGNDTIILGDGDDVAGSLDDASTPEILKPGLLSAGDDEISGGKGDDDIIDQFGSNMVAGNEGEDFIIVTDLDPNNAVTHDTVSGGWGADTIQADQGDVITGGKGIDTIGIDAGRAFDIGADFAPAIITDFEQGRDVLVIQGIGDQDPHPETPRSVSIERTDTGTRVLVSGVAAVDLPGVITLEADDIIVRESLLFLG